MQKLFLMILVLPVLLAQQALAVSLGDELILSRLGDPVEVEIDVLQWQDLDLQRVQISAANRQEYEAFGLTWSPVLDTLYFNLLGPNLDGEIRLLVSSREPVSEPFLELLLVMRWPGGSLLREYVLLFDPPGTPVPPPNVSVVPATELLAPIATAGQAISPPAPVAVTQEITQEITQATVPAVVEAVPAVQTEPEPVQPVANPVALPEPELATVTPVPEEPQPASVAAVPADVAPLPEPAAPEPAVPANVAPIPGAPEPAAPEQSDARTQLAIEVQSLSTPVAAPPTVQDTTRRQYLVRPGDSLWNIARQFQPAGAGENLYQMLLSLHDLNRGAFINGNISLLKANASMQIPGATDIARIEPANAEAMFEQRWNDGTRRFDAARSGEPLPLFGGANPAEEPPELAPDVAVALPPGQELPALVNAEQELVMASTSAVVMPLQPGQAAGFTEPAPTSVMTTTSVPPAATPAPPALLPPEPAVVPADRIAASTEALQERMQARERQVQELEQQVIAMRMRMQEARTVAAMLSNTLAQALENRQARETAYKRNSLMLGSAMLVLLAALVVAIALVFRQASALRAQRNLLAEAPAIAVETPPVPAEESGRGQRKRAVRVEPVMDSESEPAGESGPTGSAKIVTPRVAPAGEAFPEPVDLFEQMESLLATDAQPAPGKS
jgi:pilus assembly protein FimV